MKTKTTSKYLGCSFGKMAPGDRIPVDTPLAKFQRPKNSKKIQEYIAKSRGVDWNLFGYATAVRYPDGRLELINGQHRIDLVRQILPECQDVPAHIIDLNEEQYAASLFTNLNGAAAAALKSEEHFFAQIYAENPKALLLKSILEKTRFSIGQVNVKPKHREIKYANFLKCVKFGSKGFHRAAEIIDKYYPKKPVNDNFLSGMTRLFSLVDYQDLADPKTKIGRDFEQWIAGLSVLGVTQGDFEFTKYKNAGPWYDSTAYGLARHFLKKQRSQGLVSVPIGPLEDLWKSHTKKSDSDSGFFD